MVSNQQNLNQVEINKFLFELQSLGFKKDNTSGELLDINYNNVAPYSNRQRNSTTIKY